MIKLFKIHNSKGKLLKVNYVDDKNRFAGFNLEHQCCERTDHWIENSGGVRLDPDWCGMFDDLQFCDDEPTRTGDADHDDQRVTFTLISITDGEKYYLVFENCHNGWYSHAYEYGKIVSTTSYL